MSCICGHDKDEHLDDVCLKVVSFDIQSIISRSVFCSCVEFKEDFERGFDGIY